MQMNQMMPVATVMRSRFRSTTDDEPRDDEMPPPNRSDNPPPLPLCRSTSKIISRLVMIRTTENATVTAVTRLYLGGGAVCCPPEAHEGPAPRRACYRQILTNSLASRLAPP